jgi:hypothetical protein
MATSVSEICAPIYLQRLGADIRRQFSKRLTADYAPRSGVHRHRVQPEERSDQRAIHKDFDNLAVANPNEVSGRMKIGSFHE